MPRLPGAVDHQEPAGTDFAWATGGSIEPPGLTGVPGAAVFVAVGLGWAELLLPVALGAVAEEAAPAWPELEA